MELCDKKEFLIQSLVSRGYLRSRDVIEAFRKVNREDFIPGEYRRFAYEDEPLPIGEGQTISAPHMVAIMTELLEPRKSDKVFEVGTGSGYQAAILSLLVKEIVTIELDRTLYERAKKLLSGYANIKVFHGDGSKGIPEESPFDKIIVTCGSDRIYSAWKEQLKEGGMLVVPLNEGYGYQKLAVARKSKGILRVRRLMDVAFVPLRHI